MSLIVTFAAASTADAQAIGKGPGKIRTSVPCTTRDARCKALSPVCDSENKGPCWKIDEDKCCAVEDQTPMLGIKLRIQGSCSACKVQGQATVTWERDDAKKLLEFKGEFKDGRLEGKGSFHSSSGIDYEGEWKNGNLHGQGTLSQNGDSYVGQFINGRKAGKGTMKSASGMSYTGDFSNGEFHGHGVLMMPTGASWEGEFKEGMPIGTGTIRLPDGTVKQGELQPK